MQTDELIHLLAKSAVPVRRLSGPWMQTVLWLAVALPSVVAAILVMSPRDDLAQKLADIRFLVEEIAAFATAIAAAVAAFSMVIPGRSGRILFLPVLPLAVWLASLGQGCMRDWLHFGADGLKLRPDWVCFPSIALVGAIPVIAMVVMLRRGAPLSPRATVALGALAAAALGNVGLRMFHSQDAGLMVLFWQFGSVALLSALAGWMGRHVLSWHRVMVIR